MIDVIFLITACFYLVLLLVLSKQACKGKLKVSFRFFFFFGSTLYFFIPSLIVFSGKSNISTVPFLFDVMMFYIMVFIGIILANRQFSGFIDREVCIAPNIRISNFNVSLAVAVIVFFTSYFLIKVYGSLSVFLFQRYGNYNHDGVSSFTSTIPMLINGFILFYNLKFISRTKFADYLIKFVSIALIIIFLLGGNRNIAVMYLFSFIWSRSYGREMSVFYIYAVLFIGIVSAAVLAVLREYGMLSVLMGQKIVDIDSVTRYIKAYNEGEFGTAYRVEGYFNASSFESVHPPLFSYLISPIVNLIPSAVYPERPNTIAVDFTYHYWTVFKPLRGNIEGLGFSPLVEAKANFGFYGYAIFFLMAYIGFSIRTLISRLSPYVYILLFGAFSSVVLNFFRIDFALFLKFALMTFFFSYIFYLFARGFNLGIRSNA